MLEGLTSKADYEFNLYAAIAMVALFGGFFIGGLGTGLALMLVGVPVARFAGDHLGRPEGMVTGFVTAAICVAVINALSQSDESFWMLAASCFALPAALLYRRHILLERAFERP
jgi:hypothetical protein